jgi:hypothetical protein
VRWNLLVVAAGMLAAGSAAAQESLDEIAGAATQTTKKAKTVEVNGYVDNRFSYTLVDPGVSPLPTDDVPSLSELLEANVQLRVHLGDTAFAYGDVSLFFQDGWLFYTRDGNGNKVDASSHDRPSLRPFAVASELYLSWSPQSWLNLLVGKKRTVWGSGVAFNPTDLLNPPKDPTDPNLQRAGAWLARVEFPFEKWTLSAVFAPGVLYQTSGLPSRFLTYPGYPSVEQKVGLVPDTRDDATHYLMTARLYALLWDTDINLIYTFSNLFQDGFVNKSRFGVSMSRYFLTDYELHVEAMFQRGSARYFANHSCVTGGPCPDPIHEAFAPTKLESDNLYPRVLVGFRTMFHDESTLSIEYYYQGDGDSDMEFEDRMRAYDLAGRLAVAALTSSPTGALPVRFGFDPLRRHYLIASYSKPKIRDDWTLGLVVIAGLRDLSALVSPTVTWSVRDWLTLSLYGYIPVRGIPVGEAQIDGAKFSEFGMLPFDIRAMFEARAFY